ncbi:hypothetical protein HGRIS_012079 [Hohenbuehelia grisea]|uniref:Uncharacterized protein n=1 Tax=Hohenbuehelia grisea TaxID=104357 RepID=A0ABR3IR98_9AGAR
MTSTVSILDSRPNDQSTPGTPSSLRSGTSSAPIHRGGIYCIQESIFRPFVELLDVNTDDLATTSASFSSIGSSSRLEGTSQFRSRPCVVLDADCKGGGRKVCLMATFEGEVNVDNLSEILRVFLVAVHPTEPVPSDILDAFQLYTSPEWARQPQYIVTVPLITQKILRTFDRDLPNDRTEYQISEVMLSQLEEAYARQRIAWNKKCAHDQWYRVRCKSEVEGAFMKAGSRYAGSPYTESVCIEMDPGSSRYAESQYTESEYPESEFSEIPASSSMFMGLPEIEDPWRIAYQGRHSVSGASRTRGSSSNNRRKLIHRRGTSDYAAYRYGRNGNTAIGPPTPSSDAFDDWSSVPPSSPSLMSYQDPNFHSISQSVFPPYRDMFAHSPPSPTRRSRSLSICSGTLYTPGVSSPLARRPTGAVYFDEDSFAGVQGEESLEIDFGVEEEGLQASLVLRSDLNRGRVYELDGLTDFNLMSLDQGLPDAVVEEETQHKKKKKQRSKNVILSAGGLPPARQLR